MLNRNLIKEAKKAPVLFFATVLLAFCSAALMLGEYWVIAAIVHRAFIEGVPLTALYPLFAWALIFLAARTASDYFEDLCARRLATHIQTDLRRRVVQKAGDLGPMELQNHPSGSLVNLLLEGVDTLETYFRSYVPQLYKALVVPVLFLIVVFPLDAMSGVIFMATIPLIPFFMVLIGQWTRGASSRQWRLITQLSGYLQDVLRGLETLVVLGRSKEQGEKIAAISDSYRLSTLRVQRWAFISSLALELIATISIALVAVGLGLRLVEGEMVYQIALFVLLLAPEYYQPMRNLGAYFHAGLDADAAAQDLYTFLAGSDKEDIGEAYLPPLESLCFENVSYTYPHTDHAAIRGVSFTWHKGERLALVGMSGSGKTTLMRLALGIIKPDSGRILYNGHPFSPGQWHSWQRQLSYVSQKPYVFKGSLLQNITLEENPDAVARKKAEEMAEQSGLLKSLGRGLEALEMPLGSGGIALSGGQEELLFLTRAMWEDRPVLFLDEVTDNLDLLSEGHAVRTIQSLIKDRTAMIIAHRLATVEEADRVLLCVSGQLVEEGTFAQLQNGSQAFQVLLEGRGGGQ